VCVVTKILNYHSEIEEESYCTKGRYLDITVSLKIVMQREARERKFVILSSGLIKMTS